MVDMHIGVDEDGLEQIITSIGADYKSIEPPFESGMLPERAAITSIEGREERTLFSTLTVGLDFQRSSERLWTKAIDLWRSEHWIYEPAEVVTRRSELSDLFEERGMRYGQKDVNIWYQNAATLHQDYNDNPLILFEQYDYNAPDILDIVRSDSEFTYLGGQKIGPLWLRFIHEDVCPLSNITDVWMPIDTQVQKVSAPLLGGEYPLEVLRNFWTEFCHDYGFDPVTVDQPLWIIGTNWTEWGKDYLYQCMEESGYSPTERTARSESISVLPPRAEYERLSDWVDAVATTLDLNPAVVREIGEQFSTEEQ